MGKASRDKGRRVELKILHMYQDAGIPAERIPLSGAAGGSFGGDLQVSDTYRVEVKGRKSGEGFVTMERWLGEYDWLVLHRDRATPLIVMPWDLHVAQLRGRCHACAHRDATPLSGDHSLSAGSGGAPPGE